MPRRPGPAVHDDLVQRVFSAPAPNMLWLTDITEHPTMEGKLYCCSIKDVFSNRIVGYAFGPRMTAQLAVRALRSAIARRRPEGTVVVHSDRGGQFRSRAFRATLKANGLTGSMGRVAAAADNAAMESFYALWQKNVLNRRPRWRTRDELTSEIVVWIEHTYNRRRRQRGLGNSAPSPTSSPSPHHRASKTTSWQHDHPQPPSTERAAVPGHGPMLGVWSGPSSIVWRRARSDPIPSATDRPENAGVPCATGPPRSGWAIDLRLRSAHRSSRRLSSHTRSERPALPHQGARALRSERIAGEDSCFPMGDRQRTARPEFGRREHRERTGVAPLRGRAPSSGCCFDTR